MDDMVYLVWEYDRARGKESSMLIRVCRTSDEANESLRNYRRIDDGSGGYYYTTMRVEGAFIPASEREE